MRSRAWRPVRGRPLVLGLVAVLGLGCQTTLRQARELPPALVLTGPTIGLEATGPFREAALEQLEAGLARYGQTVRCDVGACQAATVVRARVLDTTVTPRLAGRNFLRAATDVVVKGTVAVEAFTGAGQPLGSGQYVGSVASNMLTAPVELTRARAVQAAVRRFLRTLLPRRLDIELAVETGGDLTPGVERALAGDLPGAEAAFTQLTTADPTHARAWYNLGVIRELSGDEERALDAYRTAYGLRGSSLYRAAVEQLERRLNAP